MNSNILNIDIQRFIKTNLNTKITDFVLKGSPFKEVSIQELANQLIAKQKCKDKLPTWFNTENIYYPQKISIEQTSSEITANYKAKLLKGNSIIDLTGGFGVDSFYFSKYFKNVTHCEINKELSEIVNHNYKQLKADNIKTIPNNGLDFLKETNETFDYIYIDPSRRNDKKGKVFLLKDCLPNVPENLDFLFSKSNNIIIKNSPILDISSAINELKFVKEIHIIAINNEVKELLFILEKGYNNSIEIKTINFNKTEIQEFNFQYNSTAKSIYNEPLTYLYEPNSAILKSGGFHHISEKYNVNKLAEHSHLYTSNELINFSGRCFKIEKILPYDKKQIIKLLPEKKANITVRNFPKSVEQIRKETKIKDGGNLYLFFTKKYDNKLCVLICKKID